MAALLGRRPVTSLTDVMASILLGRPCLRHWVVAAVPHSAVSYHRHQTPLDSLGRGSGLLPGLTDACPGLFFADEGNAAVHLKDIAL